MNDLEKIKKYYGENMMHLCRSLFSTLLEKENLLFSLLESNFQYSKFLYQDIIENNYEQEFKNYIYSMVDMEKDEKQVIENPKRLLESAGYVLYECKTEEDLQSFKKYYAENEQLCTFNGGRLNYCHVFFAVKKNVDEIRRENFTKPERQDEYGTSVISIQFSRGKVNTLSIKNRYNHRVNNPDATFSNNLENITPGLTRAFEKEYNLNINQNGKISFELPGYVKANDGKFYKYNYEINNIYYCPNNIIIDHFEVKKEYEEKEKYLIIDYFVVDLVNKKINLYDKIISDSFIDGLEYIKNIKIQKNKEKDTKILVITLEDDKNAYVEIDKYNRVTSYTNESLTSVGKVFLARNKTLSEINIPNVVTIGDGFLLENEKLLEINLPEVEAIGQCFLNDNKILIKISLPKLEKIESYFLYRNEALLEIDLPRVTDVRDYFLNNNKKLSNINMPRVLTIGGGVLKNNESLLKINLPEVAVIGYSFLHDNKNLSELNLPNLELIGDYFLYYNEGLIKIDLPNVVEIKDGFLTHNQILTEINLPEVEELGNSFLYNNEGLTKISLPQTKVIENDFLLSNQKLTEITLPELMVIGDNFLYSNEDLTKISLPKVEVIGASFLLKNQNLVEVNLPEVKKIEDFFLNHNKKITEISFPKLQRIGNYFLGNSQSLKKLILPSLEKIGEKQHTKLIKLIGRIEKTELNEESQPILQEQREDNQQLKGIKETKNTRNGIISLYKELKEYLSSKGKKR